MEGGAVGADSEDKHFPVMNRDGTDGLRRLHNYRKWAVGMTLHSEAIWGFIKS